MSSQQQPIRRSDLPSNEEIAKIASDVLTDFKRQIKGNVEGYEAWVAEVAPQIAIYTANSVSDPAKAERELDVLRGIAEAKAARLVINGQTASQDAVTNAAVLVGKILVRVLL